MRAQHEPGLGLDAVRPLGADGFDSGDVEGVLHLPRRVVGAEVQGVEVEPLVLDLRALGDLPAEPDEEVGDLLREDVERVAGAQRPAPHGDGDVHALVGGGLGRGGRFDPLAGFGQRRLDGLAGGPHEAAGHGSVGLVQPSDERVGLRDGGRVPGVGQSRGLELVRRRGRGEGPARRLDGGGDACLVQGTERCGGHISLSSVFRIRF